MTLEHVVAMHLTASDLNAAREFLVSQLGMRVVRSWTPTEQHLVVEDSTGSQVEVHEDTAASPTGLRPPTISASRSGLHFGLGLEWRSREHYNAGTNLERPQLREPGVMERLVEMVDAQTPWAIRALVTLGIPDELANGPATAHHLASVAGIEVSQLSRLLRHLEARGLLQRPDGIRFALTQLSWSLTSRSGTGLADWLHQDSAATLIAANATTMLDNLRSGAPSKGAAEEGFWESVESSPDLRTSFDSLMSMRARSSALTLAESFDWSGVNTVTDLGGGDGTTLVTICRRHQHLKGVVMDLPGTAARTVRNIQDSMPECPARVVFEAGDFFDHAPPADVLLLSRILHDWDDHAALTILRTCAESMGRASRLLVCEGLLDSGLPRQVTDSDLAMLTTLGGRERTFEEYAALAGGAGLRINAAIRLSAELFAIEMIPEQATMRSPR